MQIILGNFDYKGQTFGYSGTIPDSVVFAYSQHIPIKLRIEDERGNPANALGVDLTISSTSQFSEKRYTNAKGEVVFDISRIIQMLTDSREKELTTLNYSASRDSWLASIVSLQLSIDSNPIVYTPLEVLNGAMRPDEQWLMEPISIKYWRGLPHTFDFINVEDIELSIDGRTFLPRKWLLGESSLKAFPIMRNLTNILPIAKRVIKIRTDGVGFSYDRLVRSVNQVNIDIDKFNGDLSRYTYLRWLGPHGEIFYWLFRNGTQTIAVKSERHSIALRDNMRVGSTFLNGTRKEPTREVSRAIASEYVSREHYKVLSSVIASPYVDMYLGNVDGEDLWKRVDVADGSATEDLKLSGGKNYSLALEIKIGE